MHIMVFLQMVLHNKTRKKPALKDYVLQVLYVGIDLSSNSSKYRWLSYASFSH